MKSFETYYSAAFCSVGGRRETSLLQLFLTSDSFSSITFVALLSNIFDTIASRVLIANVVFVNKSAKLHTFNPSDLNVKYGYGTS